MDAGSRPHRGRRLLLAGVLLGVFGTTPTLTYVADLLVGAQISLTF